MHAHSLLYILLMSSYLSVFTYNDHFRVRDRALTELHKTSISTLWVVGRGAEYLNVFEMGHPAQDS
jgi:hypothetical protein